MKKLVVLMALLLCVLTISATAICDYYVGDTATLPQTTSTRTIQTDPATGHMIYLWGTYKVESDSGLLTQLTSTTYPSPAVSHTFNTVGTARYTAVITYAQLDWDTATHQWITTSSGIDKQIDNTYNVCGIPQPEGTFLSNLLTTIKHAICIAFPHFGFCPV